VARSKSFYGAYGFLSQCVASEARSRMDLPLLLTLLLPLWVRLAKMLFLDGETVGKLGTRFTGLCDLVGDSGTYKIFVKAGKDIIYINYPAVALISICH